MVNHCTPVVITVVNDTLFIASFISNLFISFFTSEIINAMMFMLIYLVLSFIAIFFKECYYVSQKCLQQNNVWSNFIVCWWVIGFLTNFEYFRPDGPLNLEFDIFPPSPVYYHTVYLIVSVSNLIQPGLIDPYLWPALELLDWILFPFLILSLFFW
jgi:hypothetical protein